MLLALSTSYCLLLAWKAWHACKPAGALAFESRASQPCYAWAAAGLAKILARASLATWGSPCACPLPAFLPAGWWPLIRSTRLSAAQGPLQHHLEWLHPGTIANGSHFWCLKLARPQYHLHSMTIICLLCWCGTGIIYFNSNAKAIEEGFD